MHIDARQLNNHSVIEGDICIIGAGIAGISIAMEWQNSPYKVILLEGGGFEYDEKVQELYKGHITGHPYYPMESSRLHYFGGTSGHWGGMCSRFEAIDFQNRDWVEGSGWPITKEDVSPFYDRVHPLLELGPNEWDLSYWQKEFSTFMPLPIDPESVYSKMWQFSPPTRFGTKYRDAIVNSKNIHLYTYANVSDLKAEENISAIKEVTIKNYADKQHTVKARHFILACCSIQNARLLLASNTQAPAGIGNDHDLVGRHFMEHIEITTGELWLHDPKSVDLYKFGKKARAELAVSAKKQEELKILHATISLWPLEVSKKLKPWVTTWQEDDPRKSLENWDKFYSDAQRKSLLKRILSASKQESFGLFTRSEQAPNPNSRVKLSTEKDSLGMPKADLSWQMSPIDKRTIRKTSELLGQVVGKAGIGRVKIAEFLWDEKDDTMPSFTSGGWHHMGTTRMSEDPNKGVVDANCKVHGISNLFVAGSSCYTTGSAVNPTYTIVALSLRLSDHLKEVIKS